MLSLAAASSTQPASMGGEYIEKLAKLSIKGHVLARVKMAGLMAQRLSPMHLVKDGEYCLVSAAGVARLSTETYKKLTIQAEGMMEEARVMLKVHKLPKAHELKLLMQHDTRLFNFLVDVDKRSEEAVQHEDLHTAADVFVKELKALTGKDIKANWPGPTAEENKMETAKNEQKIRPNLQLSQQLHLHLQRFQSHSLLWLI